MLRWCLINRLGGMVIATVLCCQWAVGSPIDSTIITDRRCAGCHTCTVPSVRDTCLKATGKISTNAFMHASHSLKEAPDEFVLASLTEKYAPVCFDHKSHAEMAEMGSSCTTCHHYSPAGEIPPCRDCHKKTSQVTASDDPRILPLESAYHNQCRNCHQDWNTDVSCAPCHNNGKTGGTSKQTGVSRQDAVPLVLVPVSKVYHTGLKDSYVTFQHMEHIELFQLQCANCHQQERCGDCHATCETGSTIADTQDARITCVCCHGKLAQTSGNGQCTAACHDVKPHEPLFHQLVGKSLPGYLGEANCGSCHENRS